MTMSTKHDRKEKELLLLSFCTAHVGEEAQVLSSHDYPLYSAASAGLCKLPQTSSKTCFWQLQDWLMTSSKDCPSLRRLPHMLESHVHPQPASQASVDSSDTAVAFAEQHPGSVVAAPLSASNDRMQMSSRQIISSTDTSLESAQAIGSAAPALAVPPFVAPPFQLVAPPQVAPLPAAPLLVAPTPAGPAPAAPALVAPPLAAPRLAAVPVAAPPLGLFPTHPYHLLLPAGRHPVQRSLLCHDSKHQQS